MIWQLSGILRSKILSIEGSMAKNYYGSGSIWSAELAAAMFSIIQTVKLWKLNPLTWLYKYLDYCVHNNNKSPENFEHFLPWSMNEERKKLFSQPLDLFSALDSS